MPQRLRKEASALPASDPLRAYQRIDLLVTIALLTVLAMLTVGALSTHEARRALCLNQHRQMTAAWLNYAFDRDGLLIGNLDGGAASSPSYSNDTWVVGWLDVSRFVPDNTNTLYLTHYSPLAVYLKRDPRPFHCPADTSLSHGTSGIPRVRSIAMNSYMGSSRAYTSGYRTFATLSRIIRPSPSRAGVFWDEREDGINDGCLFVDMSGGTNTPIALTLVDYPADWHQRAGTVSFADGHAEVWKWRDQRTMPGHVRGRALPLNQPMPYSPDILRIQAASSSRSY